MPLKRTWKVIKELFAEFFASNVMKLSGSLSFFTVFSLPGLLIIIIWFSNLFYGREVVEKSVYSQIEGFVGHDASLSIQQTIDNATQAASSNFATLVGLP